MCFYNYNLGTDEGGTPRRVIAVDLKKQKIYC